MDRTRTDRLPLDADPQEVEVEMPEKDFLFSIWSPLFGIDSAGDPCFAVSLHRFRFSADAHRAGLS